MRYTPFLDSVGIQFRDSAPDDLVHIIDQCLATVSMQIDWGEWEGRRRKPCPEQPLLLTGQPIGMYHCPYCGMMILAALPHPSPSGPDEWDEYEDEYGRDWPPGYEDEAEEVEAA